MRQQEFETYARDVTPGLLRRARLLCRDEHLAEDLVQDTLARLYLSRERIDEESNPEGYAHTVLFRHFLQQGRRASSSELVLAEPEPPAVADPADAVARRLALQQALAQLDEEARVAVVARYLDGRPAREVAQLLGRTEPWVRTTCHRALGRLRPVTPEAEEALR